MDRQECSGQVRRKKEGEGFGGGVIFAYSFRGGRKSPTEKGEEGVTGRGTAAAGVEAPVSEELQGKCGSIRTVCQKHTKPKKLCT